ncbi:spermidine/putrescine transport system substrate-binding protein [Roseovarius nanhaiticus]|uniref:Putrescine-binding periplasmic protein n=1 Tax=Roseovarius nanhaiticus TaxID=573024 RepID=A0A1N7GV68_9RHOB|nr:extracellular solute-binding protein [Roseovarius nanhaiticus]SEL31110.1 spermidine/putrescine transport system substrate-binding protein [Roseovarius nanhaiticus]SIS16348.1 spermidine/putrescine transport system substrate-binding protein [Roseovarius nanhaiticus]
MTTSTKHTAAILAAAIAAAGPAWAEGELNIYNWGNYTNPDLIEKFEQEFDVTVNLDDYDSNETMLAKVREGNSGYDIVVPSDSTAAIMIDQGLLAEVKPNEMENFSNMDPRWIDVYWDEGRNYTVPWQWGTTSFTVDTAVYDGEINTLGLLFEPPEVLQGRINMLNDMGEVINAALRYRGYERCNSNTEELRDVTELLISAKEHWRTMDYAAIEKLTSGDVDISHSYNGAAIRARDQRPTLQYAYPKEGFTGWMDNVAVLEGAPNMENAKLFMNFIMEPENAAMISNFARYANGISGSTEFMDSDIQDAPELTLPADAPAPDFVKPCPQEVTDLYNRIWTKLKQ